MKKYKLESLLKRKEYLEDKLYEATLEENKQWENLGWGSGMRLAKLPAFKKVDNIKRKLDEVNLQISESKKGVLQRQEQVLSGKSSWHMP